MSVWAGHDRFRATIGAYHVKTSMLSTPEEVILVASKLFDLPGTLSFSEMEERVLGMPTRTRRELGRRNWREVPVRVRA